MMDPIWYIAYVPVFLIGVLAGYGSGRVTGERDERDERELPVDRAHDGQAHGDGQKGVEHHANPEAEEHADGVQVVRRPGHEIARGRTLVVTK